MNLAKKLLVGVLSCTCSLSVAAAPFVGGLASATAGACAGMYVSGGADLDTMYVMASLSDVSNSPIMESIVIESTSLEQGQTRLRGKDTVRMKISLDNPSTITGVGVVFKDKISGKTINAGGQGVSLKEGKYIDVIIPEYAASGNYYIERVVLLNDKGKTTIYYNDKLYSEEFDATSKIKLTDEQSNIELAVDNPSQDINDPEADEFEFEKDKYQYNDVLNFCIAAEDDLSGLNALKIQMSDNYNNSFVISSKFDDMKHSNGVYFGSFKVSKDIADGEYCIKNIWLSDKAGNYVEYVNANLDKWNDLYGDVDTRLKLSDEICAYKIIIENDEYIDEKDSLISSSQNVKLNAFGEYEATVKIDEETFSMMTDESNIPETSIFKVNKVESGKNYKAATNAIKNVSEKAVVFDIGITDEDNAAIQPDGNVSISMNIPKGFNKDRISVYRLGEDGTYTKLNSQIKDDKLIFDTNHFSIFMVSQNLSDTIVSATYAPKTGDKTPIIMLAYVMMSAFLAMLIAYKNQFNNKN